MAAGKHAFVNSVAVCFHNEPYVVGNVQSCLPKIYDFNYGQPLENKTNKCVTMKYSAEMTVYNIVAHSVLPAPSCIFTFVKCKKKLEEVSSEELH